MPKVAVVVGSFRRESLNAKLALALTRLASPRFEFSWVRIDDLPFYEPALEAELPLPVVRMKGEIAGADAVLIVTPEYNRSIPAVLKNAIDWGTRPWGTNSWAGKPTAIAGTSPGPIGTATAQQHLRHILTILDAAVMGQPELYLMFPQGLIDDEGNVADQGTRQFLEGYVARFETWVARFATGVATDARAA